MIFASGTSQIRGLLAGFLIFILFGGYVLRGAWLPHLAEAKHRNVYVAVILLVFVTGVLLAFYLGSPAENE